MDRGIKIGLEIHQQLNTAKLFCNCPSRIKDDLADVVVTRKLRASAGETGEIDVAAAYEMGRDRHFVYQAYNGTTCLVELDEEPIHGLNKEALNVALQVAKAMDAKVIGKIQVMRKTVVDGSNTSGFQRTALIAVEGKITTKTGTITIPTICIEEESAKIVEATDSFVIYNLSRLGIPLVEIATAPEIKTPEQAREVAEHIGMILRSTGKVKRGLGTIRQDLNISIEGGARVEIKGAQDLRLLSKLAEIEISRQQKLIGISIELRKRDAEVAEKIEDITKTISESDSPMIKEALEKGHSIVALKLKGFAGLIRTEIQPDRRLGKEFSEHARQSAGVKGATHTDELPKHGITQEEANAIRERMHCRESDAVIMIADEKEKAEKGLMAIIERAKQAIIGVPKEVRKANPDGTTAYLRPMPGAARMYPETDTATITPETESIEMPELLVDKAKKFESMGISREVAKELSRSEAADDFEELAGRHHAIEPRLIAEAIIVLPKEIKKRYEAEIDMAEKIEDLGYVLGQLEQDKISRDSFEMIFLEAAKGMGIKAAVDKFKKLSDSELEKEIGMIINENSHLPFNALIGKAMEKLRGKAEGSRIVELLKKLSQ